METRHLIFLSDGSRTLGRALPCLYEGGRGLGGTLLCLHAGGRALGARRRFSFDGRLAQSPGHLQTEGLGLWLFHIEREQVQILELGEHRVVIIRGWTLGHAEFTDVERAHRVPLGSHR